VVELGRKAQQSKAVFATDKAMMWIWNIAQAARQLFRAVLGNADADLESVSVLENTTKSCLL
jgi:hypothetical protein